MQIFTNNMFIFTNAFWKEPVISQIADRLKHAWSIWNQYSVSAVTEAEFSLYSKGWDPTVSSRDLPERLINDYSHEQHGASLLLLI